VLSVPVAAVAAARAKTPVTETAAIGAVRAQLSYVRVVQSGFTSYRNLRLTITRDGRVVPSKQPPHSGTLALLWPGAPYGKSAKSVHVADLDADGEPEVELDLYTGGAHCCRLLYAYRWVGTAYVAQQVETGSAGYEQRDLEGDGLPEWVTADSRFEYLFTSFVASASPLLIYDFRAGSFVAVTKAYPSLVRKDAAKWWQTYRHRPANYAVDSRGFLAAWAADMCTLGQGAKVWPALSAALRQGKLGGPEGPTGSAYISALRHKLRAFGYRC
jgi:hypothetical protein